MKLKQEVQLEQKQEKEQEYKFLFSTKKKGGNQTLFAFNPDDNSVYKIDIQKKVAFDPFKKQEKGTHSAQVNPKHPMLWALNMRNAKRKLGIK